MTLKIVNPEVLGKPRGYANGVVVEPGTNLLFVAGQVAWNENQEIVSNDFVEQFDRALANLVTVVNAAGGTPSDIVRLVIYVTDISEYKRRTREVGERYRLQMGKHFPAMVLVEVKSLLENAALIEIEGMAAIKQD